MLRYAEHYYEKFYNEARGRTALAVSKSTSFTDSKRPMDEDSRDKSFPLPKKFLMV